MRQYPYINKTINLLIDDTNLADDRRNMIIKSILDLMDTESYISHIIFANNVKIYKFLINQKLININNNILFQIINDGNIEIMNNIVNNTDLDLNTYNVVGSPILIVAFMADKYEICKLLISHKDLNINSKTKGGYTILDFIIRLKHYELFKLIMAREDLDVNIADPEGYTTIYNLIDLGHYDLFKDLLKRADLDINKPDSDGNTPLISTVLLNKHKMFEMLFNHPKIDMDIKNSKGLNVFDIVDPIKNELIFKMLSQDKATLRLELFTPFMKNNNSDKITNLIKTFNINFQACDGYTFLMLAVKHNSIKIVKEILLYKDVNLYIKNKNNETAMDLAKNNKTISKLLSDHINIHEINKLIRN